MLNYHYDLKPLARSLRNNRTDAEQRLWYYLRRRQIMGVQFYRQRPIETFIVDFCAPTAKLIIELDGSQHHEPVDVRNDLTRTTRLESLGFTVLRFDNL